jgi:hypothetical protein
MYVRTVARGVKPRAVGPLFANCGTVEPTTAPQSSRAWLQRVACAVALLSGLGTWCNSASAEEIVQPGAAAKQSGPACASGLRLRAVQYDPKNGERSFAVFAGSPRGQLKRGARVSGYAIERIEQGAVVLSNQSQSCTVRLRGAAPARELRAISVDEVRSALRARTPLVTTLSRPGKLGS